MDPSKVDSQSLNQFSQGSSGHIFSCKWAWCRCTFFDNASLVHHVIHEHARRSIPIRRRDIALVRRVEEGSGASLHMSSLVKGMCASNSSQHLGMPRGSSSKRPNQPSSSLPSPPISSPSIDTSYVRGEHDFDNDLDDEEPCTGSHPVIARRQAENEIENALSSQPLLEHVMMHSQLLAPGQGDFQSQPEPTFASFNFQSNTPSPISIPASPSFSSLVSKKRKLNFDISEREPASQAQILRSRSHPLSQSTSTESSSTSRASVVMQLTQSLSDGNSSSDDDNPGKCGQKAAQRSSEPIATEFLADDTHEENLYQDELSWGSSQFEEFHQKPAEVEHENSSSESQETGPEFASFGSLSQPPSQFQHDSFPFHHHRHHGAELSELQFIQTDLTSNVPLPRSTPAPLASPKFAISTPIRQNWYQPAPRRKSGQMVQDSGSDQGTQTSTNSNRSRLKSADGQSPAPKSRSPTKKKSVFRSGTLQIMSITPEHLHCSQEEENKPKQASLKAKSDTLAALDNSQESIGVDQDSFEELLYPPLQTQAPYESQPMSQI